ncbi:hypothetical protein K438DRAFT_1774772 [Mycena galopus ATCC 62051]|nr:hypothetical protein K438DRAFT_1774772 [Mycena galopus ATCC 62051]
MFSVQVRVCAYLVILLPVNFIRSPNNNWHGEIYDNIQDYIPEATLPRLEVRDIENDIVVSPWYYKWIIYVVPFRVRLDSDPAVDSPVVARWADRARELTNVHRESAHGKPHPRSHTTHRTLPVEAAPRLRLSPFLRRRLAPCFISSVVYMSSSNRFARMDTAPRPTSPGPLEPSGARPKVTLWRLLNTAAIIGFGIYQTYPETLSFASALPPSGGKPADRHITASLWVIAIAIALFAPNLLCSHMANSRIIAWIRGKLQSGGANRAQTPAIVAVFATCAAGLLNAGQIAFHLYSFTRGSGPPQSFALVWLITMGISILVPMAVYRVYPAWV